MSDATDAFRGLTKLTSRLERLCGEYMSVYVSLGDNQIGDAHPKELNSILQKLEEANSGLVMWIAKARGLEHRSIVLTHKDASKILKGENP